MDDRKEQGRRVRSLDRRSLLVALVKALVAVDATPPLAGLLKHAASRDTVYDLTDVHVAATTASYEAACKTYDRDRKNLAKIRAVETQLSAGVR